MKRRGHQWSRRWAWLSIPFQIPAFPWNKGGLKHFQERHTRELKTSWEMTREPYMSARRVRTLHPWSACGNPPTGWIQTQDKNEKKGMCLGKFVTTQACFLAWYISDRNLAKCLLGKYLVRFRKTVWRNGLVVNQNVWSDCLGRRNSKAGEVCSGHQKAQSRAWRSALPRMGAQASEHELIGWLTVSCECFPWCGFQQGSRRYSLFCKVVSYYRTQSNSL